jgi:hypothetical protein
MWFNTRGFLRIKLKLLTLEQLVDLRRDITAALILTTEETEKRYRAALEQSGDCRGIEEARVSLAQRADYLEAARSFLWADFLWPSLPVDEHEAGLPESVSPAVGRDAGRLS